MTSPRRPRRAPEPRPRRVPPWSSAARSIRLSERDRRDPRERGGQEHHADREEHHQRIGAHRLESRQAAGHELHHGPQQEAAGGECEEPGQRARAAGSRRAAGATAGRDPRRASPASRARGASSRRAAAAGSRRSRSRSAAPARRPRTARASRAHVAHHDVRVRSARPAACRAGESGGSLGLEPRRPRPRARSSPARASTPGRSRATRSTSRRMPSRKAGFISIEASGRERHPGLDAARVRERPAA